MVGVLRLIFMGRLSIFVCDISIKMQPSKIKYPFLIQLNNSMVFFPFDTSLYIFPKIRQIKIFKNIIE